MQIKWKYVWSPEIEERFSKADEIMKDVSQMISYGCELKDVKAKFRQLEISK
jgi:5-methylcytosine-specific restriction endonuclease McrBC regulatory subunit McrC